MAPDVLGPMSSQTAQLIENAFEEEQYAYAVDSLRIATKLGVHPTRDLFLALMAIAYSHVDDRNTQWKGSKRSQYDEHDEMPRIRKLGTCELQDIEPETASVATLLLRTLVRQAPNAVRAFLPPFASAEQNNNVENVFTGRQEREWLRNAESHENSANDMRSRSTSISSTPLMHIASRMLECRNVWQLLSIDVDQCSADDASPLDRRSNSGAKLHATTARRQALVALREEDDEAYEDYKVRIVSQYGRSGTWAVLGILNDLWQCEREELHRQAASDGHWWHCHLAQQFRQRDWRRTKPSAITDMYQAFDLIRAGFLSRRDGGTANSIKRGIHAVKLVQELVHLTEHGVLDETTIVRLCSDGVLLADGCSLPFLNDDCGSKMILVKAVVRSLHQSNTTLETWDNKTKEAFDACFAFPNLPARTKALLEIIWGDLSWLSHKDDYSEEEATELRRLIKESEISVKAKHVESVLSYPPWQLFEARTRRQALLAKRKRDDNQQGGNDEDRLNMQVVNAQFIAACVRLHAMNCICARLNSQAYLLATIDQAARESLKQKSVLHQHLCTIVSSVGDKLHGAFLRDAAAVASCYEGIIETCWRAEKAMRVEWKNVLLEWAAVMQQMQRRSYEAKVALETLEAARG